MAGSSAGGMTAGLAAGLLGMNFESVTAQPPPDRPAKARNNNLYESWVNTIDIDPLLGTQDLDDDRRAGPVAPRLLDPRRHRRQGFPVRAASGDEGPALRG